MENYIAKKNTNNIIFEYDQANKYKDELQKFNEFNDIKKIYINNMYTNNIYKAAEEKDFFSARQLINSEKISTDEIKDRIESFLSNPNEVLNRISPSFLRKNESVIIASLQRNIDSIRCVDPEYINEHILEVAITEAIKQDYVIDAFTPTSMLENEEFVISCIERDINCVNFIRDGYLTPKIIDFATKQMLEKEYIITKETPLEFKKNIDIVRKSIELDSNSINFLSFEYLKAQLQK